ncbi:MULTISPECIES: 2-succinyl-5-enolpyruvyl-6-hydroxy-3-cyclohexene-1-carboxylic-acid synthase [unclassified Rathayibacter]|uniref:2-succinyl-5-enolpyruvyl-6-hydroxy-3- cyclohexene-1-carboxylic-acid synthase n=1 Tax=unclassified Rathayibacter TaxID=2609250 RepID=UPI000CE7E1AF|nr:MULTISPECIES: 2-succinyl-5-enolpyruvyl-6-hydroxy-3-cyclohexene-1-carboxylic-acid synthase [unclassified Rathayibacter]PPF19183.1 2-succinyl-5-enolpyruvyl-6-hydroxy-3-cyclohexene-1-carboxylic-acid synthase [Rathayibacter sp. AY1A4]PPG84443.1 2-succinyl-5-enolpyruvyl-6-hydroxy-3-cyclohexene-1-carboxylic-acid synthase [Rathayibacter sp. AY1E5]PPH32366.1 2-succinyl-5-enolpyruvyl-6-hydroxy-3-cyclohexene-1-carboxylic-acid synthase [Rathayibacter sp. AY1C3]PPH65723.1 2-succinyl-5-enolpyruvyl-6-hydr
MPEHRPVAPSTRFAVDLLIRFVALGVRDVVVAPGSRSQALALVAAELETRGDIRLHVRIDERSAGFLALGLALESRMPALVITTSGTATANLHPAVLEADASDVPMIVLTADRPDELRGIRSNQTAEQRELYGRAARLFEDVAAPDDASLPEDARALADRAVTAARRGPVHLNLSFRDPLSSALPHMERVEPVSSPAAGSGIPRAVVTAGPGEPLTVVIAGDKAGAAAEEIARAGDWPLLAEVSSGARFGPQLVVAWRGLLGEPDFGGRIRRAIVLGHPTLSREVPELLRREDVEVIVVDAVREQFYNPGRRARRVGGVDVVRPEGSPRPERGERAWAGSWVSASRALTVDPDELDEVPDAGSMSVEDRRGYARNALAAIRAPLTRDFVVAAVWKVTWPHDRLLFGASRLIRVADGTLPGKRISVLANRGLAGIDGTISTALGIAVASQATEQGAGGVTRAVLGDLTLLHEAGGLLLPPGERRPRVQLVVVNDGGGTIFDGLEVASSSHPDAFDRVQFTPQNADLEALARAYGWGHRRAATRGELEQALTSPGDGPGIVEIRLER